MRPVILPAGTSMDTPSTACRPSKWRWMSLAISSGRSATGASAAASTVHVLDHRRALEHTARFGPHSVRPEPQEADDQQADRDPLQRGDQAGRPDRGRNEAGQLFEPDRDQKRTQAAPIGRVDDPRREHEYESDAYGSDADVEELVGLRVRVDLV